MEYGIRVRTTCPVYCKEGFIPLGTEGRVLCATESGSNAYLCKFTNVEIEMAPGVTKTVTVTTTVLLKNISEIPVSVPA